MSRGFPRKLGLPTGGGLIQANSITALHVNLELGTGNVSKLTLMKLNDMLIVKAKKTLCKQYRTYQSSNPMICKTYICFKFN